MFLGTSTIKDLHYVFPNDMPYPKIRAIAPVLPGNGANPLRARLFVGLVHSKADVYIA